MDPYIARLFQIESGGNPYAVTGSNRGLGQFGPAEEAQYGINDQNRTDPAAQAAAVQRERAQYAPSLQKALGRDPHAGEDYLVHQQGQAGGPALLTGGDMPAWQAIRPFYKSDAMAQKAISGNLPTASGLDPAKTTAKQFSQFWVNKFEGGQGGSQPQQTASAAPSPGPAPFQAIPPATAPNLPLFGQAAQGALATAAPAAPPPSFFSTMPAPQPQQQIASMFGNSQPAPQAAPMPQAPPSRPPPDLGSLLAFLQSARQPYAG